MDKSSSADGSVDAVTKPVDTVTGMTVMADFERRGHSAFIPSERYKKPAPQCRIKTNVKKPCSRKDGALSDGLCSQRPARCGGAECVSRLRREVCIPRPEVRAPFYSLVGFNVRIYFEHRRAFFLRSVSRRPAARISLRRRRCRRIRRRKYRRCGRTRRRPRWCRGFPRRSRRCCASG